MQKLSNRAKPLKTIIARHRQGPKTGGRYARLPRDRPPQPGAALAVASVALAVAGAALAVAGAALAVATLC
jgi:hypothetical protein